MDSIPLQPIRRDSEPLSPLRRESPAWTPRQRSATLRPLPPPQPIAWPEPVVLPADIVFAQREVYIPLAQKMPPLGNVPWGKQVQRTPPAPPPAAAPTPTLAELAARERALRPLQLPTLVEARKRAERQPVGERLAQATRAPAPPPLPNPPPPLPPMPSKYPTTYRAGSPRPTPAPFIQPRHASLPRPRQPWLAGEPSRRGSSELPYLGTPPGSPRRAGSPKRKPVPVLTDQELEEGLIGIAL